MIYYVTHGILYKDLGDCSHILGKDIFLSEIIF